jgi:hypothetical protein
MVAKEIENEDIKATKKKIGRPPISLDLLSMSLGKPEDVTRMAAIGMTIPMMANLFGVDDNTLYRRMDPEHNTYDPSFREAFKRGLVMDQTHALLALRRLVDDGNTAAIIYSCKTKCGMLEVRKVEGSVAHQHTVIEFKDVVKAAKMIEDEKKKDVIEGEVVEEESSSQ